MGRILVLLGIFVSIVLAWGFIYKSADPTSYPTEAPTLHPERQDPYFDWVKVAVDVVEFAFPKTPFTATEEVPVKDRQTAKYQMYVTEDVADAVYNANVITYPDGYEFHDVSIFMPRLVRSIVGVETQFKEASMEPIVHQEVAGYRFVFTSPTQLLKGQILNRGSKFYLMIVIQESGKYDDAALEYYLNSFSLSSAP